MFKFISLENGKRILRDLLASRVSYDNSSSGLISDNVQGAIDELSGVTPQSNLEIDGGFAAVIFLPSQCLEGGSASSVYSASQMLNGGDANGN